jgi:hypothetical protein
MISALTGSQYNGDFSYWEKLLSSAEVPEECFPRREC